MLQKPRLKTTATSVVVLHTKFLTSNSQYSWTSFEKEENFLFEAS